MDDKLYNYMNWAEIEAVVYSEEDKPHDILGAHVVADGTIVSTFLPNAVEVKVIKEDGTAFLMSEVDEEGFFSVLIHDKKPFKYTITATYEDGNEWSFIDPYNFPMTLPMDKLRAFNAGVCYDIYKVLGAHLKTIDGVEGVQFAVWAPNAVRVSVVGDFNNWDGRIYQMRRVEDTGVFELFIPGIKEGAIYKYEVKFKGQMTALKSDPYAFEAELRPNNASIIRDIDNYQWQDSEWQEKQNDIDYKNEAVSIYELHLGSFMKPEDGRLFYTYRELAPKVIDYVKTMNYTHIEIMPIMEHPLDASWGYQTTGYYAPTKRYGNANDFKYFIDECHKASIGVILDWVPAQFPKDDFGLAYFDGTHLYNHADKRQGECVELGTLLYNYGRPEVRNFLIANALFWAKEYHADGIRMGIIPSMLYLDYGKNPGEWVANMYGGNENLEAIQFIKQLNSIFKRMKLSTMLIAQEPTAWPRVTGDVNKNSLGFDFKWHTGWINDFIEFMRFDPIYRKAHYDELIFSMIYAYSENFVLSFSHDEVVHGKGSMVGKMPGPVTELRFANLRVTYGFMYMHPGKKLMFMGQDFGQYNEWDQEKSIPWDVLRYDEHKCLNNYVRDLNKLYLSETALYQLDYDPDGFEWINNISADETILVFMRKAADDKTLVIVANFTPVERLDYTIGVPYAGKYKEIFNSDSVEYGGKGITNSSFIASEAVECDGRDNSLKLNVPPLGISVLKYYPKQLKKEKEGNE